MNQPCLHCDERSERCHSSCEKYLAWKQIWEAKKEASKRRERGEREILAYKGTKCGRQY